MIHGPTGSSAAGTGQRYQAIARICSAVLSLPPRLAAITPYRITQNRSPRDAQLADQDHAR